MVAQISKGARPWTNNMKRPKSKNENMRKQLKALCSHQREASRFPKRTRKQGRVSSIQEERRSENQAEYLGLVLTRVSRGSRIKSKIGRSGISCWRTRDKEMIVRSATMTRSYERDMASKRINPQLSSRSSACVAIPTHRSDVIR